jgi:replicative DNA helicase
MFNSSDFTLPHVTESEKILLGSLILNPDLYNTVSEVLVVSDFYDPKHKIIYKVIVDLFTEYKHFTLPKLLESLRNAKKLEDIGGEFYLYNLQELSAPAVSMQEYAKNIKRVSNSRSTILDSIELIKMCREVSDEDIAEKTQQLISKINKRESTSSEITYLTMKQAIQVTVNSMMCQHENNLVTQFPQLNSLINGFQNADMIDIGARPSIGKTALALTFAMNLISNNHKVGFMSAEMSTPQMMKRMFVQISGISYQKLSRTGIDSTNDLEALTKTINYLENLPNLSIDDKSMHISQIKRSARQMKENEGIEILFIDYIQRLTAGGKKDNQEMSFISCELKSLAKELDIPVIVLSQLSRLVDSRPDKRPIMSDLRDSGAIEQDADIIMMLYRDDYYNKEDSQTPNDLEINVIKNRNGEIGTLHLFNDKQTMTFKNYSGSYE